MSATDRSLHQVIAPPNARAREGGDVDPLITLLRFIEALPGGDPLAPVNPAAIFAAMSAAMPGLAPADLALAGGVASHLGSRLRQISWALRRLPRPGKQPRVYVRVGETRRQAEARYEQSGRAGVRRFPPGHPKLLALPNVMAQWRQYLGVGTQWRVQDAIRRASAADDFHAALSSDAFDGHVIAAQRLGTWLAYVKGLTVGGLAFKCMQIKRGYPRWALVEVSPTDPAHRVSG
jgi:hypothetical protein